MAVRTTKGTATSAWAIGISQGDVLMSTGQSKATRKPSPIVTADVPSGSISRVSRPAPALPRAAGDGHGRTEPHPL